MQQPTANGSTNDPVVYAIYLFTADRSPLNFDDNAIDKFVGDVAVYGDTGIQKCLETIERLRPKWREAWLGIANNRNAYWHKDETIEQSFTYVRDGFITAVKKLCMKLQGHIAVLPPLYNLVTTAT